MFTLNNQWYGLESLYQAFKQQTPVQLGAESQNSISKSHKYLSERLGQGDLRFYGINTGFGSLCDVKIENHEIEQLQYNLLRSHACGTGETIPEEMVRMILLLKVINLAQGYSGVQPAVVNKLIEFYNEGICPILYEYGSLGASGDLAPLAHLSLPLIGEGEIWQNGRRTPASKTVTSPIRLGPKDGLALINGTQFSTAYTYWSLMESQRLLDWAIRIAAMSIDVFGCQREPYDSRIHEIRRQKGQIEVARSINQLLDGSQMEDLAGQYVQDPYAFRCTPQVLGATLDTLNHVKVVVENEINAVTDNPNIFADSEGILTGGNFHAQPIALAADFLAIAMAEVASISERRTYQLIGGKRGLPSYLTQHAGKQSGFMIVQYSAASVVSHNKQLCTPSSVDSIVSSQGQEDHVSMAANAAVKLKKVVENVERVLAMELMTAMQALDFRKPHVSSPILMDIHQKYREEVRFANEDRPLYRDIEDTIRFMRKM